MLYRGGSAPRRSPPSRWLAPVPVRPGDRAGIRGRRRSKRGHPPFDGARGQEPAATGLRRHHHGRDHRSGGGDSVRTLDPALPLPAVLGLSLRWAADGPLASTLLQVLTETAPSSPGACPLPADLYQAFARALLSRAGIHEATQLRAALACPLTDALREVEVAESRTGDRSPDGNWATGFRRLADSCVPMCGTHESPIP